MDSQRFDALARRLGGAGTRRQALAALAAGTFTHVILRPEVDEAAAGCKGYQGKCKKKAACCAKDGLRCRGGRCRCKKGWQRCQQGAVGCTHVTSDPDHCGACGNACPPATPCCVNGSCQETCGESCCVDCFVDKLNGVIPQPSTETCCSPESGTFCSAKKHDQADDECCWPDQECIKGQCCCDGCMGAVICGGTCCPSASCCNGKCCAAGQVCGMTAEGLACVSPNRACAVDADCLPGESCEGGVCCSGDRICNGVCCPPGEYCDKLDPMNVGCCAINTTCKTTWRGHRVRR